MKSYRFALCAGRHTMPVDQAIFGEIVDPTNIDELRQTAQAAIPEDCEALDLYATGLTVALLAVVQVCNDRGITLTVYHYNRENGEYFPQNMDVWETCPWCKRRKRYSDRICPHCGGN